MKILKHKRNGELRKSYFLGILMIKRTRKVYASAGNLEFVRYVYKILGLFTYRTQSIVEALGDFKLDTNSFATFLNPQKSIGGGGSLLMDIGKTIVEDKNIHTRLLKFAYGLDEDNKRYFFQLVARIKKAYLDKNHCVYDLSLEELLYFKEIESKFYANIFEAGGVYCYNGYFLPKWQFEVGVFYDKHGLYRLSEKTLKEIKGKDFIDVGGYVGDSALVFREFTNKKIYSFEATKQNYDFMLECTDDA